MSKQYVPVVVIGVFRLLRLSDTIRLNHQKIGNFILASQYDHYDVMMSIDVHRLELQKFFLFFCVAHLPVKRDEISVFLILDMHVQNKRYGNKPK